MNFWQKLEKPIMAMAPMADVTDAAFRKLFAKYSVPGSYVTWTEFVSADGLALAPAEGKQKLLLDFKYTEAERPIVAQLFSSNEAHMEAAAALCAELGFDGVDINMGCPVGKIVDQGCGAAMIKTPVLAQKIIRAAKRGAGNIPVSVKTRIGYHEDEIDTWIPTLLQEKPAALTVHLRTRKQMSKVPADWEKLSQIIVLRDQLSPETLIFGNGDVLSLEDAHRKAAQSGADGVMIGRALFGNPWFFNPQRRLPTELTSLPTHGVDVDTLTVDRADDATVEYVSLEERLNVMCEHSRLFTQLLGQKNFSVMKKHYKAYVNGFVGAKELRIALMSTNSPAEVEALVHEFLAETNKG